MLFAPRNAATESLLIQYVEQALGRWEPRIDLLTVEALDDEGPDGAWLVAIQYRLKDTHDERSLVYPFFIGAEA